MVAHLKTTVVTPLWCLPDDEVPVEERRRRAEAFRHANLKVLDDDCSQTVHFCELWRGKELYKDFAPTWDDFCLEVLKVEPAWVDKICDGLRLLRAQGHTGTVTVSMAERVAEVQALRENGGDRKSEQFQFDDRQTEKTPGGNASRYHLARLKRDHPAIAEALARGEYPSVHAAAKAAGIVRDKTPLETLHTVWRKVSPHDRVRFLIEMLTPAERRQVLCGLDEEEER